MWKLLILIILMFGAPLSGCGGGSSPTAVDTPPSNQSPTANAGTDQSANEGTAVSLVGIGSDSDGTIVSYSWQQDSGATVTILNADTANASFIAPMVGVTENLVFRLTVTDNEGATASDITTVSVIDRSAEWDAFIASLDTRITTEWIQLESDQTAARANAGNSFNNPSYLVNARERFIIHVDDFFVFAENEITRLADAGITFPRDVIVAALSDARSIWESLLDDFLVGSYFTGWPTNNLDGIIRVEALWAIDFIYSWLVDRIDASAAGPWEELLVSLEYGFILETKALEAKKNKSPTSGSNLAAARNVFIGHVNSSFDYLYDETIRFTNDGDLFSRDDVIALLNTYGEIWQDYLDWYVENGPFSAAYGRSDFDTIFIPDVLTAIEAAIDNTLSRLDSSGRLT